MQKRCPFFVGHALLIATLACLSGCGKSYGTLSGTVKLDDNSVLSGSILVISKDGLDTAQGVIAPDGTYKVEKVPFGDVQIAVISPDPANTPAAKLGPEALKKLEAKGWKAPPAADNSKWFEIPAHYAAVATSGITLKMDQKNKTYDIVMKGPPPQ